MTSVPFMALTATASDDTQLSIVKSLHMADCVTISHCLNRPNIFISVSEIKGLTVSCYVRRLLGVFQSIFFHVM